MKSNGKKILIIVLIVFALLLLSGGVLAYIYFATDIFKTGQELFAKYLMQNVEDLNQTVSFTKIDELEEKLKQSKYEENTEISYIESGETESSMKIKTDTQNDPTIGKVYGILDLSLEGIEKSLQLEYMKENNMYSLRFTNAIKQFLSVRNSNLKQFAQNLGVDATTIEEIPDTIDFEKFSFEDLNFTDEEINTEINKYFQLLYDNIAEEKYQKHKDAVITVNGKTITTNSYTLTLTSQEARDLEIKALETLKQDEIVLAKLNEVFNKISEILGEFTTDLDDNSSEDLKNNFISSIQKSIDELKAKEITEEANILITIYEENKETVRIKVENGLNYITLDTTKSDGKKQVDIDYTSIDEQNTQLSNKVTFIKENDNKLNIKFSNVDGEEQFNTNLNVELIENGNNTKIDVIMESEGNQLIFSRNVNIVDEISYKVVLDSSNNIILNDLQLEEILNIFNLIGGKLNTEYVEPLKPIVETIIEPIKMIIMMYSNNQSEQEDLFEENNNLIDIETQTFNSRFQVYEGTNKSATQVNALLNTVFGHNQQELNERYVVVSGDITLQVNASEVVSVDGDDYYTVVCKVDIDGFINEIQIEKTSDSEESNLLESLQ